MNLEHIASILALHKKWLLGDKYGKRADLRGANLGEANLSGADLGGANLGGANLGWTNLRGADLRGADLRDANLRGADLRGANLGEANLRGADLRGADLRGANLGGANLGWTNLRDANLSRANLRGANLRRAIFDYRTIGMHAAPEGKLTGYKKLANGTICRIEVPEDARRSCATTRKYRCERAFVLEGAGHTMHDGVKTEYRPGNEVRPDSWDDNRWNECSHGIHFFLTREEAEAWNV